MTPLPFPRAPGSAARQLPSMAIGAGSLAALFVSETWGLFGFREFGDRGVIVLLIALEAGAACLLAGFLATVLRSRP